MKKILTIFLSVTLLSSCSENPFEIPVEYDHCENFYFNTGNTNIEFVKDSTEKIIFIGNATSYPGNYLSIEETNWQTLTDTLKYLEITGNSWESKFDLNKIEVHYKNLRRLNFALKNPPINYGVYLTRHINTREPIVEDTLEMVLMNRHQGIMEINTSYLKLTGGFVTQIQLKGIATKVETSFSIGDYNGFSSTYNFSELQTDSFFLNINNNYFQGYTQYARIDVNVDTFLEVNTNYFLPPLSECPDCKVEVYYKGYPTILNHDSLDTRIVLIDNN